MTRADCSENFDALKLVRDGTDQPRRAKSGPDPARARVDEHRPEHAMVFASAYSAYLRYFGPDGIAADTWQKFFTSDVSAQLAVVAVEDVAVYRATVTTLLRSLKDPPLPASAPDMADALRAVFDCLGTLARRLDDLQQQLPAEQPLRQTLANLIRGQLSPMLRELIGYYVAGDALGVIDRTAPPRDDVRILGQPLESFDALITGNGLSAEWPAGAGAPDWPAYVTVDATDLERYKGAYGLGATTVERINHLATHNLFTAICDAFLAVYARVVDEAKAAVDATFEWDGHKPHYALLLAFLKLFEYAREAANGLSAKHLAFYYGDVLQLEKRKAEPGHAHVLFELAKHVTAHRLDKGTQLKAGKDSTGADADFGVDRELVANRAQVADIKRLYRHSATEPPSIDHDRIFAAPDTPTGDSWDPFAEKVYKDGELTSIAMPPAEVGFAIASHYLWMAEGTRHIKVSFRQPAPGNSAAAKLDVHLRCRLTTTKGWIDKPVVVLTESLTDLSFELDLDGNDPPITPYDPAIHGYGFATGLPVLVVTLEHLPDKPWDYAALEGLQFDEVTLAVEVDGIKTLMLSNDHGPIDASKPFLAYGSTPLANSALVIGSKEVFQKAPKTVTVNVKFMTDPVASGNAPTVTADYLYNGTWSSLEGSPVLVKTTQYGFDQITQPATGVPDLTPDVPYSTSTRAGFIRLKLSGGFGTDTYPVALATWIATIPRDESEKPPAPVLPTVSSLTVDYTATQKIDLSKTSEAGGRFFHVTPFGHVPQLLAVDAKNVPLPLFLLPQFRADQSEGELYIGVSGLEPPQNLALLFQVVDGTANPLALKPEEHIHWSYLRDNEWTPFATDGVNDGTNGLLDSGIVTLAVPADATAEHTLLPSGRHWIRLAVGSTSDAVCRLLTIAAQAAPATYVVPDNGASPKTDPLPPETITKLDPPDAAVTAVQQPFPTFGGRPVETPVAFATRVSERLRHKDRAIALWDCEHLILESFPAIYQARCLNHTQYEPNVSGTGIYRELAPGHVTVVTIPDLDIPNPRDPLRPYTSLGVLEEIKQFLAKRTSCFVQLHVRNPQFEEVRVDLRVRFRKDVDDTFSTVQLKREITQFLSPWAFRADARPTFNGRLSKSVLVDFIEERAYVDYVSDVHLFHRLPGVTADGPDLEEVTGSRAISILVSAQDHDVRPIHAHDAIVREQCACAPAVT